MRTGDFENRWSSPKQLYNEYMSNYNMTRNDSAGQLSQPRISKIPIGRIVTESEQPVARRLQADVIKKENTHNLTDQTRILSAFKSQLCSLKSDVTRLISTNRDFTKAHNSVSITCEQQSTGKDTGRRVDTFDTPRNNQSVSQNSTVLKNPTQSFDVRFQEQATMHKIPLARNDSSSTQQQLREDLRGSSIRESRLIDERDQLCRKLQQRSRELDSIRNPNMGHLSDRVHVSNPQRESNQRQYDIIIEGLHRQNSELQSYYKQKLQQAERERKSMEEAATARENQLSGLRQEVNHLGYMIRSHQEKDYPRTINNLQEQNRKLQKDILELNFKIRTTQVKCTQQEDRLNRLEETKRSVEVEKSRLLEEVYKLRESARIAADEITALKQSRETLRYEKDKQIENLNYQKKLLMKAKEQNESKLNEQLEKGRNPSKSEMSKSSIVQLSSALIPQSNLLQQAKKQQIDKMNAKIEQLKKQRRTLQHDIKGLIETRDAIESSIKNIPLSKTLDQLKAQLTQKDQLISSMCDNARKLQEQKTSNQRLMQRVKINELLLREANESIMKRELGVLSKKYK